MHGRGPRRRQRLIRSRVPERTLFTPPRHSHVPTTGPNVTNAVRNACQKDIIWPGAVFTTGGGGGDLDRTPLQRYGVAVSHFSRNTGISIPLSPFYCIVFIILREDAKGDQREVFLFIQCGYEKKKHQNLS